MSGIYIIETDNDIINTYDDSLLEQWVIDFK
jgi:hypothetical protein